MSIEQTVNKLISNAKGRYKDNPKKARIELEISERILTEHMYRNEINLTEEPYFTYARRIMEGYKIMRGEK